MRRFVGHYSQFTGLLEGFLENPFATFGPIQNMGPPAPRPSFPIPVDEAIEKSAFEFFSRFAKASADYVTTKVPRFEFYRNLYDGKIGLRDWADYTEGRSSTSQARKSRTGEEVDNTSHLSNYVYPIAPNVNTLAHSLLVQVFSGPEWFTIIGENSVSSVSSPADVPTAYKLQQLLKDMLIQGDAQGAVLNAIIGWIVFGTAVAKVHWHEQSIKKISFPDGYTPQIVPEPIYSCPLTTLIPLNMWLPDPSAVHTDVQRWRAIGHRVIRPFDAVMEGFSGGDYFLNAELFQQRYQNSGNNRTDGSVGFLDRDVDADNYLESELNLVQLWELEGKFPSPYGLIEGSATIATESSSKDPSDGVLIRVTTEPATESGLRRWVLSHYTEQPGPFGAGMIEENASNIKIVSQFTAQLQDVARYTGCAARMVRKGSSTEIWLDEHGRIQPGDMIPFDNDGDMQQVPNPNTDINAIQAAKSEMLRILERDTGVTDTFAGLSAGSRITATHANILQEQSQTPATARGILFGGKFIERAWQLCLDLIAQHTIRERQIFIKDYDGRDVPVIITPEEIRGGKWKVKLSLTNQDSLGVAKAQSLIQFMQMANQLMPALQMEGRVVSLAECAQRYLDALRIGNTDRILRVLGPQEQMMMQQLQMLQQENQMLQQQLAGASKKEKGEKEDEPEERPQQGPPPEQMPPPSPQQAMSDQDIFAAMLQEQALSGGNGGPGNAF